LKNLSNVQYTAQWYNPITNTYNTPTTVNITNGTYAIGNKPDNNDWVLLFKKNVTPVLNSGIVSTFETTDVPSVWSAFGGSGSLSISSTVAHTGSKSLCLSNRANTWDSPSINLYDTFKANGAGTYTLSYWVYVDTLSPSPSNGDLLIRGTSADANSFIVNNGGNYYASLATGITTLEKTWVKYSASVTVLSTDLTRSTGTFDFVIGQLIVSPGQKIYIDDFTIYK